MSMSSTQKQWFAFYSGLSPTGKSVLDKHIAMSAQIQKLGDIQHFLVNEFHKKKSAFNRDTQHYKPYQSCFKAYEALFLGQEMASSFDPFPASFKSALESLMYQEMEDVKAITSHQSRCNLGDVYHDTAALVQETFPDQYKLNWDDWTFEAKHGESLTRKDQVILQAFRTQMFDLCSKSVEALTDGGLKIRARGLEQEIAVIHKALISL